MLEAVVNSRAFKIIYGKILPIVIIVLLLGVASFISPPKEPICCDFLIRLLICIWFSVLYIRLSRFSSFSFYPNKKWSKSDVGEREKYVYIGLSFFGSVGSGILTWFIFYWYFPNFPYLAWMAAVLNSLIIFLPIATQYWVLKF